MGEIADIEERRITNQVTVTTKDREVKHFTGNVEIILTEYEKVFALVDMDKSVVIAHFPVSEVKHTHFIPDIKAGVYEK